MFDFQDQEDQYDFVITGDLNSRISDWSYRANDLEDEEVDREEDDWSRSSRDTVVNENGKRLIELCTAFKFTPIGGIKKKNFDDRFTYVGPGGSSQNDHYICSTELVEEIEHYKTVNRIESKHMPITMEIKSGKYKVKSPKEQGKTRRIKWQENKRIEVENILNREEVKNLVQQAEEQVDQNIDEGVALFTEAMRKANKPMETITQPNRTGKQRKQPWFNKECERKKNEVSKLLNIFNKNKAMANRNRSEEARKNYLDKKLEYHKLIKEKRKQYNAETKEQLKQDCNDSKKFWQTMKKLSARKTQLADISKERWKEHFIKVYNPDKSQGRNGVTNQGENISWDEEEIVTDEEMDEEITEGEIKNVIKNLKKDKATGLDEISADLLQTAGQKVTPFLKKLFNRMYTISYFPIEWVTAIVVPLFKKGDKDKEDNYRGISLLSIPSKIMTAILNKRLYKWAEDNHKISDDQAGFRRSYSTIDHIYTLYSMATNCVYGRRRSKLYVAYIDYRKAFDLVNRNKLFEILKKKEVPSKMLKMIMAIYNIVDVVIRYGSDLTEKIGCPLGVRQGCLLSPLLFSLMITEVATKIAERGRAGYQFIPGGREIFSLLFADDIVLVGTTPTGLQNQINSLEMASLELGLQVNLDKTKVMVFRRGGYLGGRERWFFGNDKLEVVNSYKYLGYTLTTKLSVDIALAEYAGRAKGRVVSIVRILYKLGQLDIQLFFKLFDTQVKPILLYAAEIWGTREKGLEAIERVHLFACRKLLGVTSKTPKTLIYSELNRYPLKIDSIMRTIKYWFKLLNLEEERIPKQAYAREKIEINKKEGWGNTLKKILETNGYAYIWRDEGTENKNGFLKSFRQRLIDQFWQNTQEKINDRGRFNTYREFKQGHEREAYLQQITISKFRRIFARARMGIIDIRFNETFHKPDNNFKCPFCIKIENELHIRLECPTYQFLRHKFISRYWITTNNLTLRDLFNNENTDITRGVAMFLYYAMKKRDSLI